MTLPLSSSKTAGYQIPSDHLEQLTQGISALTVAPYRNALYYFFPWIGAFISSYNLNDLGLEAMIGESKHLFLKEITDLTACAGISKVVPYFAMNHHFSSAGGSLSFTSPILIIPYQRLIRIIFHQNPSQPYVSLFTQEKQEEKLSERLECYSDDQTRFLISRCLAEIKEDNALLRIAIKVAILATVFVIYASPFGWPVRAAIFLGVFGTFTISERFFHARADINGAKILQKRLGAQGNAKEIAISTLEKMRSQNLKRREQSKVARIYITSSGNNIFDFQNSLLTTRIERLSKAELGG